MHFIDKFKFVRSTLSKSTVKKKVTKEERGKTRTICKFKETAENEANNS